MNTRVLMDEIKLKKPGATLDDFPDAELERIAKDGYDFLYFLGVWQTGEFGMKKSIKLLDLEPCMKVGRNTSSPRDSWGGRSQCGFLTLFAKKIRTPTPMPCFITFPEGARHGAAQRPPALHHASLARARATLNPKRLNPKP